jgi:hypothetical protein
MLGAAWRSEWVRSAIDALRDVRQARLRAGNGGLGRGPEVFRLAGADTGEFAAHGVGDAALSRCTGIEITRVGQVRYEQAHIVDPVVEFDRLDVELGAHAAHGVPAEGEHLADGYDRL